MNDISVVAEGILHRLVRNYDHDKALPTNIKIALEFRMRKQTVKTAMAVLTKAGFFRLDGKLRFFDIAAIEEIYK